MKLRWEKSANGPGAEFAYNHKLDIGFIGQREDGSWFYDATLSIHTKWISKGGGDVTSRRAAKAEVQRVWDAFCEKAGLSQQNDEADLLIKGALAELALLKDIAPGWPGTCRRFYRLNGIELRKSVSAFLAPIEQLPWQLPEEYQRHVSRLKGLVA